MSMTRRIGEASDHAERRLEAAVARVPEWKGRDVKYSALVGGLSNQNWLVEVEGHERRYFLKVPGEGTELFVDRLATNEAARNSHGLGLAPEVIFFDPSDGLEVSEFMEGYRACTTTDFMSPIIQEEVISLYRRFHSGPRLRLTKTIFDMIEEHWEQGKELGALFPPDMAWLRHRYQHAKDAFLAAGLDLVPCFNDPMPGNFLISPNKPMRLIDYEFSSTNERAYDLGVLFAEMFYDEQRTNDLIEIYFGKVTEKVVARVILNRALADLKWASWAVVNRKLNNWDFDYQKYGVWKYMRARSLMFDSRWEYWLRKI